MFVQVPILDLPELQLDQLDGLARRCRQSRCIQRVGTGLLAPTGLNAHVPGQVPSVVKAPGVVHDVVVGCADRLFRVSQRDSARDARG